MPIERILPGTRYSEAVVAGPLVFLSGMVPENTESDIQGQTRDVLAQIDKTLALLGLQKTAVVDCTIYLPSMDDYAGMNEVWDAWVVAGQAPARVTVEARLANSAWRIEIKATAYRE
jgi:enamine deaminase RidA (YjgF/YER057c/UK114 family)